MIIINKQTILSGTIEIGGIYSVPETVTGTSFTNVTYNSARITWTKPTAYVTIASYHIYNSVGTLLYTVNGEDTLYKDITGLTAETEYSYKIKAYDIMGGESVNFSSLITFTTAVFVPSSLNTNLVSYKNGTIWSNASTTTNSDAIVSDSTLNIDGAFTVNAWIKPTELNVRNMYIFGKIERSTQFHQGFYLLSTTAVGGGFYLHHANSNTQKAYGYTANQLTVGTYKMVTYVRNAGTGLGTIYVNGSPITWGTNNDGWNLDSSNNIYNVTVGNADGAQSPTEAPFIGDIGPVADWNRALSQSEITELYNGGVGKTYPFN